MFRLFLTALLLISGCIGGGNAAFATVSSNITKVIYQGDSVSTSFNFGTGGYSVPVYLNTDIQVYVEAANGTITQLTLNNQYSVTLTQVPYSLTNTVVYYTAVINLAGGSSPWGALQTGTTLILNRSIPYTNLLNITDYSSTPASTYNQGYDRGTMLSQQLYTLLQQSVLQPVSATTPISIPVAENGYVLCWSGTSLSNCLNNGSGPAIPVPIPNSYLSTLTTAGLVNGSALTSLSSVPSGAGPLPIANIPIGTTSTSSIPYINSSGNVIINAGGNVGIGSNSPGQVLDVQGTIRATGLIAPLQYVKITNTQSSGTGGGTATSGSWIIIPLNKIDSDTGGNVVSNSSTTGFVLAAGTYEVEGFCPFFTVNGGQTRLYNVTGSTLLITGEGVYTAAAADYTVNSHIRGIFTIAAAQTLEFQYKVSTTAATVGLGQDVSFDQEVYATVILHRLS